VTIVSLMIPLIAIGLCLAVMIAWNEVAVRKDREQIQAVRERSRHL
jgi:hypothetical protein